MTDRHGAAQPGAVETHTADEVPDRARHGGVRALFALGFGTHIAPLALVTGAMAVQVCHQPLWSGVLAVLVGQLLGGMCTASRWASGPRPGGPRGLRSRAGFGSPGARPGVAVAAAVYIAFFAVHLVLAGWSLHALAPNLPVGAGILPVGTDVPPVATGILLAAVGSALLCLTGRRLRRLLHKAAAVVLGLGSLAGLAVVVARGLPSDFLTRGGFTFAGWCALVSLSALWQPALAPYAAGPARSLSRPARTAAFRATYGGSCLGSLLPFLAGAVVAPACPGPDSVAGCDAAAGAFAPVLPALFLVIVLHHSALNLYRAVRTTLTLGQPLRARWAAGAVGALVLACGPVLALGLAGDFVPRFADLTLVLLAVLVPWAVIHVVEAALLPARSRRRCDGGAVFSVREQAARILDPLRPLYPEDVRGFADTR
ncbi:cytosine permease [Streptomyces sp. bgisy084]|uniref:cytosine permease n=1 Tax=unclassified Streptomyces TaxID=2593676 RepID=UPI003D746815